MHPEKRGERQRDAALGWAPAAGGTRQCVLGCATCGLARTGSISIGCMSRRCGKKALQDRHCGRDRDGASDWYWCERERTCIDGGGVLATARQQRRGRAGAGSAAGAGREHRRGSVKRSSRDWDGRPSVSDPWKIAKTSVDVDAVARGRLRAQAVRRRPVRQASERHRRPRPIRNGRGCTIARGGHGGGGRLQNQWPRPFPSSRRH